MEGNNRSKKINIKNHACHYFDVIIGRLVQTGRFSCQWYLLNEKSNRNILIYDIL